MWMKMSVKPGTTTLRVRKIDRRRGRVNAVVEGDLPAIVSGKLFYGPLLPKQIKKVRSEGCDALHCRFTPLLPPGLRIIAEFWPDLLGPSEKVKEVTIRYPRVLDYVWSQGNQGKLVGWGLIPCRQLQEMVPIYLPPWYSHQDLQELYVLRVEYEGSLPIRWGDRLVHDYGSFEVLRALPGEVEVGLWELGMEILSGGKDKRIRVRRYPRIATWDLGISWWLAGVPGLGVSEAALEELRSGKPQDLPLLIDAPPLGREIFAHLATSYPAVCGEMAMRAYPSFHTFLKFLREDPRLLESWKKRLKSPGIGKKDVGGLIKEYIGEEVRKNMEWFRGEVEKMVEGLFLEWEEEPPPIAVQTCAIRLGIQSSSKELFKSGVIELLNRRMYEVNVAGMFAGEAIVGEYYGIPPHIAYAMGWWLPRSYNGFVLIAEAGSGYTEVIPYDRLRVMEGCTSFVVPPDFGAQKSSGTKKIFLVPLLTKDIEGGPTPFSLPVFESKDTIKDWKQKLRMHPLLYLT